MLEGKIDKIDIDNMISQTASKTSVSQVLTKLESTQDHMK